MDFQKLTQVCRSVRTVYSKPFSSVPESINFSADSRQVLFLSSGSLYSDEVSLPGSDNYLDEGVSVLYQL